MQPSKDVTPGRKWKSWLDLAAVVVALVLVANPELRALLMLADAVGVEALVLLVMAQFRFCGPLLSTWLQPSIAATCRATFTGLGLTTRLFGLLSPHGYLTHLFQWSVAATTQDVQCAGRASGHVQTSP
jgi:hypothetical protein